MEVSSCIAASAPDRRGKLAGSWQSEERKSTKREEKAQWQFTAEPHCCDAYSLYVGHMHKRLSLK